jgi:hypothetical protein
MSFCEKPRVTVAPGGMGGIGRFHGYSQTVETVPALRANIIIKQKKINL